VAQLNRGLGIVADTRRVSHFSLLPIEDAPSFGYAQDRFSRALSEKRDDESCGGNELGSEDQDFGCGEEIIKQNPYFSQNQGELRHPQFVCRLFTDGSGPPADLLPLLEKATRPL
jgi:hypothetical protein